MRRFGLLFPCAIILIMAIMGCDAIPPGDSTPPGAVTMTGATANGIQMTLAWTDPADADLASIRVEWKPAADSGFTSSSVTAGAEAYVLSGMFAAGRYDFRLTALDGAENGSTPVSFSVTVTATALDYHFIYTAAELDAVRGGVAGYADWDLADGYDLMGDVSLADYAAGEGWVPLGNDTTRFQGVFEGNGHTVSGLAIDRPGTDYQGLFGYVDDTGRVNDLTVQGSVEGRSTVGGLAGVCEGEVLGCRSDVTTVGSDPASQDIGGLLGSLAGGAITDSSATGNVSGAYRVGGLVGYANGGSITDSFATGNVGSSFDRIGGLVGYNTATILRCHATGAVTGVNNQNGGLVGLSAAGASITSSYATGAVSGEDCTGGLIGENVGDVTLCYATGAATSGYSAAGGLIGYMTSGAVDECWASGNASTAGGGLAAGGFIGQMDAGMIANCYSWGNASTNSGAGGFMGSLIAGTVRFCYSLGSATASVSRGGFLGGAADYSGVSDCYYNRERSGCTGANFNAVDVLTANMMVKDTYAGWDFAGDTIDGTADYWTFGPLNNGYPYLPDNPALW